MFAVCGGYPSVEAFSIEDRATEQEISYFVTLLSWSKGHVVIAEQLMCKVLFMLKPGNGKCT